jgi:2-oxoisovalerate ferredoxin oxidoreductase delta subunit
MTKERREAKQIIIESERDMPPMAMSLGSMLVNRTGSWRNLRPEIDYEKCIECGICWKFCPEPCIDIVDDKPVIDYDYCKGCGICAEECPKDAITMIEEGK